MYIVSVTLLMFVLPVASILVEKLWLHSGADLLTLAGKWSVFWAVGIRLFIAGLRQVVQPGFTLKEIFGITGREAYVIVQELGFANVSIGLLGILTLFRPDWILAAALAGGLYYGLAGVRHIFNSEKNALEYFATISDLYICAVLLGFFAGSLLT